MAFLHAYGLSLYGNMPLIEPLETRETYKIRDFVIVLDTSYSVSGELVEHFLQETFTILTKHCKPAQKLLVASSASFRGQFPHHYLLALGFAVL